MTPVQIAYFKHFLYDTGVNKMYVYRYRHFRIKGIPGGDEKGNPESLEQFFMEQPHSRVIMNAFYFEVNSQYGYDFWKGINQKWLKYWEMNENNINNNSYAMLKGNFGVLRQNWDKDNFWYKENLETNEEVYKRMGIEPPFPIETSNTLYKFKIGDIIQSRISEEVRTITDILTEGYKLEDGGIIEFDKGKYWMKIDEKPDTIENEEKDITNPSGVSEYDNDDLEFFDVSSGSRSKSTRLKANQASLNFRSNSYKLSFNQEATKKIKKNAYKYVRLAKNKQGDIVVQLHKQELPIPNPVNVTFNTNSDGRTVNACINSKDLCGKLKTLLNLTGDYFVLKIEELYMDFDKANYKVTK